MKTEEAALETKFKLKIPNPKVKPKTNQAKPNFSNIPKPIKINTNPKNKSNFISSKTKDNNHNNTVHSDLTKNTSSLNNKKQIPSITKDQKQAKNSITQNMKLKKKFQTKNEDQKLDNEKEIIVNQKNDKFIYNNTEAINEENLNLFKKRDQKTKKNERNRSFICEEKCDNELTDLNPDHLNTMILNRLSVNEKPIPKNKKISNTNINKVHKNFNLTCKNNNSITPIEIKKRSTLNYSNNNQSSGIRINIDINIKKNFSKIIPNKNIMKIPGTSKKEEDDIFQYDESKPITLTKEEKLLYGDRCMKGYKKSRILGKGGYGVVWLCNKINDDENFEYAVKQTSKKNEPNNSRNLNDILHIAKNEIDILNTLNENNEKSCDLIPKIYESYEDNNDVWFSFEKGGLSISSLTFNIKGIFEKGERLYHIQKGEFLLLLFKHKKQFKYLIKKILQGIEFINNKGIIHSDIKPENILVQYTNNNENFEITSVKIIDYGSAFYSSNPAPLISNTPEYLCPEITTNNKEFIKELNNNNYINSVDVWSTGIALLELCLCCPIWMSYKTKILINGKYNHNIGYFGCKGRDGNKIYQKQVELQQSLRKILKNSMIYMFDKQNQELFIDLLEKMLTFDYTKRINAKDALNHPFFNDINEKGEVTNINQI